VITRRPANRPAHHFRVRPVFAVLAMGAVAGLFAACGGGSGGSSSTEAPSTEVSTGESSSGNTEGFAPEPLCADATAKPTVDPMSLLPAVALVRGSEPSLALAEVNVTQTEVNVFVVRDGQLLAYVVCGTQVFPPEDEGEPYDGPTFADTAIDVTPQVLAKVEATIRDSHVVALSATPGPDGRIDYIATLTAPGGEFRVLLAADGSVLATE